MKRLFYFALVLLLIGLTIWGLRYLSRDAGKKSTQDIQTTKAVLRDINETLSATGEVAPARKTPVKSEVSGRIARLHVSIGDTVEQGQLLVELDRSELLSQKEELLRAIESSVLRQKKARRDFERLEGLFKQGFVTDKENQDAETEMRLADNSLEIDRARLQTLEEKLSRTSIQAPQDGVVISCDVEEGEVIVGANSAAQGTIIMVVADLTRLLIKADINEVDVARLSNSAPVQLTFDSAPGVTTEGLIKSISPSARIDTQNKVRNFPVEIACEAGDRRIRPGITANVSVPLSAVSQVVAVVVSSVFADGTNRVVFIKNGNKFEKVSVTTGINDANYVEIKSGLDVDDEIALTRPADFVKAATDEKAEVSRKGRRMLRGRK
ncbi:MAG: efflux RND transporter periplasmic adaptor subunit [Lentisphaerota bacterium]